MASAILFVFWLHKTWEVCQAIRKLELLDPQLSECPIPAELKKNSVGDPSS